MQKVATQFFIGFSSIFWLPNQRVTATFLLLSLSLLVLPFLFRVSLFLYKPRSALVDKTSSLLVKGAEKSRVVSFGLFWACLNVFIWFNYSQTVIKEPQLETFHGYPCSVIPEQNKRNIQTKDNHHSFRHSSIGFDFCITHRVVSDTPLKNTSNSKSLTQPVNILSDNKLKLTIYRPGTGDIELLMKGELLEVIAKVKPNHGRINPGSFDYEKWLVSNGYLGTGYVREMSLVEIEDKGLAFNSLFNMKQLYHSSRQLIFSKLEHLTAPLEFQGLILALSVGEKEHIPDAQWDTFISSGTSHLLAISGLHIGIAALWSYYFMFYILKSLNYMGRNKVFISPYRYATIASIIGATTIALMSGMGYPAQRALIMLVIFILTKNSNRHFTMASILSWTFISVCLIQPFAILSTSFWLSFLAVAIILFSVSTGVDSKYRYPKFMAWLRMNWYIFIALLPITTFFFGKVSIVSIGANIILIPITSFITAPLIYLSMLLSGINDNWSILLFSLSDKVLKVSYSIQHWFAEIQTLYFGIDQNYYDLFAVLLILIFSLVTISPPKLLSRSILFPIALTLLFGFIYKMDLGTQKITSNIVKLDKPDEVIQPDQFKMIVFDIGQGLGIYIDANGERILYDTGYGNSEYSMAASVILPFLNLNNIETIDKLIISHGDSDHRGGLEAIIQSIETKEILSGEPLNIKVIEPRIKQAKIIDAHLDDSKIKDCHNYPDWSVSSIKFKFLDYNQVGKNNALLSKLSSSNNRSCVLSIEVAGAKILLTGDIEKQAEKRLIEFGITPHDIVVAPHHGSLTSSNEILVSKLNARSVIFSTGYANQWNFPKAKVVKRYADLGADIYITHNTGAVSIELVKGQLKISNERNNQLHFWNANNIN